MGTIYTVKVTGGVSESQRETFRTAIGKELANVDVKMSTYRDDSELSRFNQHRDTSPLTVSGDLFEVLAAAQEISHLTGGAYDITVGPLVNAWGFGPEGFLGLEVEERELETLRERVGYDKLILDESSQTLAKSRGDLSCDLSSIAKGYAVDRVADALADLGVESFWVEIGGEVRAAGVNPHGQTWRLGIERPQPAPGEVQRIVPLDHRAVATSGDYRNYRERRGERISHIIDPRTGWPIRHRLASVSVVQHRCMIADAWATALMVMGAEEGYELAQRLSLAAFFLIRDGEGFRELGTPAFWELTR